jgi:ribonuclease-3
LANEIALGPALKLGKGEEKTQGRTKESLLGDAFEAVVGALYLDQGLNVVQDYLRRMFQNLIPESKKVETSQDYKTRLQEYHQRLFKKSPRYVVEGESGPDHSKTFRVRIEFQGKVLAKGEGRSKREAEQDAARIAFNDVKDVELPPRASRKKQRPRSLKRTNAPLTPETTASSDRNSQKEQK